MIFSIKLKEDQFIDLNNFESLETILSEFYEKNRSRTRGDAKQSLQTQVTDYFSEIIKNKSNDAENIEKLSKLSPISIIRLYHSVLNQDKKTMRIIELTPEFLFKALSHTVLKDTYFTSISEIPIICFTLPDIYQVYCLNIFASHFKVDCHLWVLKGILCVRDGLSITITKNTEKKKWILNSKFSKCSKYQDFPNLTSAFAAASVKGFLPISFFYFIDNTEVPSETLSSQTLKYAQLMNPQHRLISKFKSKCFTKDKFKAQVVENIKKLGIVDYERQIENFESKTENFTAETKAIVKDMPVEDMKKNTQFIKFENVNIRDKFSYEAENFNDINFSINLKADLKKSAQNIPLNGYETFDSQNSLSLIDKVETKNETSDWACFDCQALNQSYNGNTCQNCRGIKFCYFCKIFSYSSQMACYNCSRGFK